MEIFKGSNQKHPHRIVDFTQDMFFNWVKYLGQFFVKRNVDMKGKKALLQGSVWRSCGWSPDLIIQPDGYTKVEMVHHPGEIWLKYSHDDQEPWTKIDLRRESKRKSQYMYGRDKGGDMSNIATEVLQLSSLLHLVF